MLLLHTRLHKITFSSNFNSSSTCSKLGVALFDLCKNCVKLTFGERREVGEGLAQDTKIFFRGSNGNQSEVQKVKEFIKEVSIWKELSA